MQVEGGPGSHWCTCSPPVLGSSQHLGWVALRGPSTQAPACRAGPWVRHGPELLLCCGAGVDAQGSYRGE